jgi:predicted enzyme related to lactoylglutathione lyase
MKQLPERSAYIMETQELIELEIKKTLERRMNHYAKRFGWTHDDMFTWLACDIKHAILSRAAHIMAKQERR